MQTLVLPDTDGINSVNKFCKGELSSEGSNTSLKCIKEEHLEHVDAMCYNTVSIKEEELSINSDSNGEEEDMPINNGSNRYHYTDPHSIEHFRQDCSERRNVPESTWGKEGSTHRVYLKEEYPIKIERHDDDVTQHTSAQLEEDVIVNEHFLSQYLEPYQPIYQYTNGKSVETECASLTRASELSTFNTILSELDGSGSIVISNNKLLCDSQDDSNCKSHDSVKHNKWKKNKHEKSEFSEIKQEESKNYKLTSVKNKAAAILTCQYCPYQTTVNQVLRVHVINKHNFAMSPIDCPYCKYRSLSILEIEDHIQRKHKAPKVYHSCPYSCGYKTAFPGNIKYHICAKHTKKMNFFCPYCDYKCILLHNMGRHILKIHRINLKKRRLLEETSL